MFPAYTSVHMYVVHTYTQADGGTPYTVLNITQRASYVCVCVCVCMHAHSVWLFATPWDAAHQVPLSMGFSQQVLSGLPFPPPGESSWLRDQTHVSCVSCIAGGFFTTVSPEKKCAYIIIYTCPVLPSCFLRAILYSLVWLLHDFIWVPNWQTLGLL